MEQADGAEDWSGSWFEDHPLAHVVYDPVTQQQLAVNRAAVERYGYAREALLQMTRGELLFEPAQQPQLDVLLAALRSGQPVAVHPVWLERSKSGRMLQSDTRSRPVTFRGRPARLAVIQDAEPRMRLQEQVAEQRELWRVAAAMARVGGWSLDPADGRLVCSDEVCMLHERPAGRPLTLDEALSHYPGEAGTAMRRLLEACATAGTPFDLELPFVTAGGRAGWVRNAGVALRAESGRIERVQGVLQDISARKQAEIALTDSRERLAAILQALPDLWFIVDADGRFAEVSREDHPSLAARWPDQQGRRVEDCVEPALAATIVEAIAHARRSGLPQSYRYAIAVHSGEMRQFEARCIALGDGRALTLVRDTTETARLEQRFHDLAEAAPVGIFEADATGAVGYVNPHLAALLGLGGDAALGGGWLQALHPDDRARVQSQWLRIVAGGRDDAQEFRVRRPDGGVRHLAGQWHAVRDLQGSVIGWVGAMFDTSERRQLEQALRERAVAEEARSRQVEFLSRMSHELRTPLNAILGFGQLLEAAPPGDETRRRGYAQHIVEAGRHMLTLVEDLLALQAIEQGVVHADLQAVAPQEIVATVAELLSPLARERDVVLLDRCAGAPAVRADRQRLRQALLNLLSNAIKYNRPGGRATVSARPHTTPDGAPRVLLVVEDEGAGLDEAQLARLFQPFERLGRLDAEGTGLGLVITRQLVRLMGGELRVDSAPGRGTRMTVDLPAA